MTPVRNAKFVQLSGRVGENHFSFADAEVAKVPIVAGSDEIPELVKRTETHILLKSTFFSATEVTFSVTHIGNPPVPGISSWKISTFRDIPEDQAEPTDD